MENNGNDLKKDTNFLDILNEIEYINDEQAEILGKINHSLNLNRLKSLSLNAAKFLVNREKGTNNTLSLNGIIELEDGVFDVITKSKTPLSLNGLIELNENKAKSLIKNHKDYVSLNGLQNISDNVASILAKFKGFLYLYGINKLSDNAVNSLVKYQGRALGLSNNLKSLFNKSVYLITDENKNMELCLIRLKPNNGWVYLYAVGYAGGGVYLESFFKFKEENSIFFIYEKSSIPYESWDSFYKDEEEFQDHDLELSKEDNSIISEVLDYAKKEWLKYEDEITLNEESKKLVKKNFFASRNWYEGRQLIYEIISKRWNLSYKW